MDNTFELKDFTKINLNVPIPDLLDIHLPSLPSLAKGPLHVQIPHTFCNYQCKG